MGRARSPPALGRDATERMCFALAAAGPLPSAAVSPWASARRAALQFFDDTALIAEAHLDGDTHQRGEGKPVLATDRILHERSSKRFGHVPNLPGRQLVSIDAKQPSTHARHEGTELSACSDARERKLRHKLIETAGAVVISLRIDRSHDRVDDRSRQRSALPLLSRGLSCHAFHPMVRQSKVTNSARRTKMPASMFCASVTIGTSVPRYLGNEAVVDRPKIHGTVHRIRNDDGRVVNGPVAAVHRGSPTAKAKQYAVSVEGSSTTASRRIHPPASTTRHVGRLTVGSWRNEGRRRT